MMKSICKRYLLHMRWNFSFELSLVLAVCYTEAIVGVGTLVHAVWRGCGANGHDSGRTLSTLCLADLIHSHHLLKYLKYYSLQQRSRQTEKRLSSSRK